jgi:hypothetical protein
LLSRWKGFGRANERFQVFALIEGAGIYILSASNSVSIGRMLKSSTRRIDLPLRISPVRQKHGGTSGGAAGTAPTGPGPATTGAGSTKGGTSDAAANAPTYI